MRRRSALLLLVLFLASLAGCASSRQEADALAQRGGLASRLVDGGPFTLQTFASPRQIAGHPLSVYIEGDGYAWIKRDRLSDDPTPKKPIALEMAVKDTAPNILYIARPCQFVTGAARRNCHPAYWSTARFSDEVVTAISKVIDHYRSEAGAEKIRLYGYSGGGTIALLLAARRTDVELVATVAAVLDTEAWTRFHDVTPLERSMNPASFAASLARIPQTHFLGANDKTVPVEIADSYLARFAPSKRPRAIVLAGQEHECCWGGIWTELLAGLSPPP